MQFRWQPYANIIGYIPADMRGWQAQWSAVVSLVCLEIIEWHMSDCVMRQLVLNKASLLIL